MKRLSALILALWIQGCREGQSVSVEPSADRGQTASGGARLLPLAGTTFRVGSDDPEALAEERPGFVRFSNDVWVDTVEMRQSEYLSLVGRNPSKVVGDDLPVTDVSWFDAVVAANARSRRDGLDSVYEFSSVRRDPTGAVLELTEFGVHLDRNGWRLPTEAEWEAAARAGTRSAYAWGTLADSGLASRYAWSQANSSGRPHPVGELEANGWGLHDMAGNVMEWVGDWKGPFPAEAVEGFAGQESPADVPEIALKGGAYNYGLQSLRPSSRKATYAAYKSARTEYVGFRLVRGGFAARYSSATGIAIDASQVSLSARSMSSVLGTAAVHLVFVNRSSGKGVLSWVDYSEPNPVVRSLPDPDPVFHPAISPDGKWVAWSTAMEGSTGPSKIKARRLSRKDTAVLDLGEGAIPRWWSSGTDTFLVVAKALDNTLDSWHSTRTIARKWSAGVLGAEEVWSDAGSYHDGRSGPYLYSGYRRLRRLDLGSGSQRVLFTSPSNGKPAEDTSQVCNVSAAPDGSGSAMFLDFGYAGVSTVVGRPYGIHEIGFMVDSTGNVVRWFPAPAGERQWEHLEWTNVASWAVSGAIDGSGAYRNVYVVDLHSGIGTKIASGRELWHPALWIDKASSIPGGLWADSLLSYATPLTNPFQPIFDSKSAAFWIQRDSIELVAVGSSHVAFGIAPGEFSLRAFNIGLDGAGVQFDAEVLRRMVISHASHLKVVVLGVMPGWMLWQENSGSGTAVLESDGWRYDQSHNFWTDSVPSGLVRVAERKDWSNQGEFARDGGRFSTAVGWGSVAQSLDVATDSLQGAVFARNWARLSGVVDLLSDSGIHVVLVNFPVSPLFRATPRAGLWEPYWNTYHEILKRMKGLETRSNRIHFVDANLDGLHDYTDGEAKDWDHLATPGAIKLSRRLDSLIGSFALKKDSP